jgi:chemotaxis protein CheD
VQIVVGVSDAKVSADKGDVILTYSLGSCIGVTLHDPQTGIGGMLHFQLPTSTVDPARAAEKPLMYADTGMKCLIGKMESMGANRKRMTVRMAGAAQMLDDAKIFDIGRRNHTAIRKFLWQQGMLIKAEHIGGSVPRTLIMNMQDGSVAVKLNSQIIPL